jgi:HSP90 family molecular chaperone
MSGEPPRNKVETLRIRISPPRNNTNRKKIWNGENWISRANALSIKKKIASELVRIYEKSANDYDKLYERIQEYKRMGSSEDELIFVNRRLIQLLKIVEQDKIEAETAIHEYNELRNTPITPKNQRKNRRSKTRR